MAILVLSSPLPSAPFAEALRRAAPDIAVWTEPRVAPPDAVEADPRLAHEARHPAALSATCACCARPAPASTSCSSTTCRPGCR